MPQLAVRMPTGLTLTVVFTVIRVLLVTVTPCAGTSPLLNCVAYRVKIFRGIFDLWTIQ